jgi:hypothetical protein
MKTKTINTKGTVSQDRAECLNGNLFENCTSQYNLVFPHAMVSEILVGATTLRSLKMHKDLWLGTVQPSLVENVSGFAQFVEFYGNADVLNLGQKKRIKGFLYLWYLR